MVTYAGERLVQCVHVERFALFIEVSGPFVVEVIEIDHAQGGQTGVVDVNVGDNPTAGGVLVEDASVEDGLGHALYVEKVTVVSHFPNATGVDTAWHVALYEEIVRGAVGIVRWIGTITVEPRGDSGVDDATAVLGAHASTHR